MERKYVIPLRKEFLKVPIYLRTRKAVKTVKIFTAKHMKTDDVRIGKYLNLKLWSRGNRNPPHKVEVVAELIDNKEIKYVKVELVGAPKGVKKEVKKKKLLERLKNKVEGKGDAVSEIAKKENKELADEVKEEKKEAEKVIQKEQEKLMEAKKSPIKTPKKEMKPEIQAREKKEHVIAESKGKK